MIADALRELLQTTPGVRLAVLFGSGAHGRLRRQSDVDIGLLLDDPDNGLVPLTVALARATHRNVDLVPLAGAPPLLRFEIARHGNVLVERDPGEWAAFKARAMRDWWDWAPTARKIQAVMVVRLRQEAARGPA